MGQRFWWDNWICRHCHTINPRLNPDRKRKTIQLKCRTCGKRREARCG